MTGGKSKKKKKKVRPPVKFLGVVSLDEILTESSYLALESDRGCVLVAGAAIDEAIVRLLRAFFKKSCAPDDRSAWATFLLEKQPVPPLGSFGVRAATCFALGLIDAEDFNAIRHLADTRNTFAHFAKSLEILPNDIPPVVIHGDQVAIDEQKARLGKLFEGLRSLGEAKRFSGARIGFMVNIATLLQTIFRYERELSQC